MRVCYVIAYAEDSSISALEAILRNYTLREFADNVASLGHEVDVIHLFHHNESVHRNGVNYHFVRPSRFLAALANLVARLRGGQARSHYLPGFAMLPVIREVQPGVIHFFGLTLDINLWLIGRVARKLTTPLVVQYHSGDPARNRIRRLVQMRNVRLADRLLFTTKQHAQPWIDSGMPIDTRKIVPFMETSSTFQWRTRKDAREETGMAGDPVFLWTGRLHPEKDPFTALRGFERIQQRWDGAQLYLYYLTDELLLDLQAFVARKPRLGKCVHFRGRAVYHAMEDIYNSADFFIQASKRETSGCAVLEAMSCGTIPVVTDIPSFRAMTENGRHGVLFPVGDADVLVDGVLNVRLEDIDALSRSVHARWNSALSFPVLALQLDEIYHEVSRIQDSYAVEAEPVAR